MVFNRRMKQKLNPTLEADKALIQAFGGPTQLAMLLGFTKPGGVQRVQNWTVRGIPPAIKVKRPEIFLRDIKAQRKVATK